MGFQQFKSPSLPVPPEVYEQSYMSSLINNLQYFFGIIDSRAPMTLDAVAPSVLQLPVGALTLSNGANNNIGIPSKSFVRITGPSGAFNITGIAKPALGSATNNPDGTLLILYNSTAQAMTITNDSASSTAANRIYTNTGSDVATTGRGTTIFIYSVTDARWLLVAAAV